MNPKKNIKPAKLSRRLGLFSVTMYGLGNILGAGIYVLVGKVVGAAGFGSPLAFLMAATVAGLTAFSYMELSSRYPVSGSVSAYVHHAFRNKSISLTIGLLMIAGGVVSAAVLSRGFAGYAAELVNIPQWVYVSLLIIFMTGLVAKGIGESVSVAVVFTFVEIIGLGLVLFAGRHELIHIATDIKSYIHVDPNFGYYGVFAGAFLAFYAYIGFEDMVNVAEETKRATRTIPKAILLSLGLATILYLAIIIISINSVSIAELSASDAPLTLIINKLTPQVALFVTVIGLAAAINGIIAHMIMGSRMFYALARKGWLAREFAEIDAESHTQVFSTIIFSAMVLLAALVLPLVSLAKLTSLLLLTIFCFVHIALIIIKKRSGVHDPIYKVPLAIPVLGLVSCIGIMLFQVVA